jgi:hypothetical protein
MPNSDLYNCRVCGLRLDDPPGATMDALRFMSTAHAAESNSVIRMRRRRVPRGTERNGSMTAQSGASLLKCRPIGIGLRNSIRCRRNFVEVVTGRKFTAWIIGGADA